MWNKVVLSSLLLSLSLILGPARAGNATHSDSSDMVDNLFMQLFDNLTKARDDLENPEMWPRDYAHSLLTHGPKVHDYIVIGAGTAGSVVASRLSEDPSVSVLVVEAGGDPPSMSEMYTLSLLLKNTSYTWNDYTEPNPTSCQAMKGGRCYWLRGKMVSGTGGINGNVFLAGRPEDYDEWHEQGNTGWSWQDVYPYFVKATEDESAPGNPKGSLVLSNFQRLENFHILNDLMVNATEEVEAHYAMKSLGFMQDIPATVDKGRRMSTGKTYLGRVDRYRRNLNVLKNAVVRKILINNRKRAVGVEVVLGDSKVLKLQARKEIIVSAGTFNSPKLLMLSGIGPLQHLKSLNIPCLKNLPVGRNLQDHGMMPMIFKFTRNIPDMEESDSLQSTFDYLAYQRGPLADNKNLVGFINTWARENFNGTDVMLVTGIDQPTKDSNVFEFLQFREDIVANFLKQVENQTILEVQGLLIKPTSRGYLELKSADYLQGPLIQNNYATSRQDRETLLRLVRFVQKLSRTKTFRYYGLELVRIPLDDCDALVYDSDEYWLCYVKYFFISAWHGVGTCPMGPVSDRKAVVDPQLRVHGIRGLRVIDASIMPTITSGNTNGPTIMIGEKGSQMVKEEIPNAI